jgi:hypothetical protein
VSLCSLFGIDRTPNSGEDGAMSVAEDAFVEAVSALGLSARVAEGRADLLLNVHGRHVPVELTSRATVSEAQLTGLSRMDDRVPFLHVMVADRLVASGRDTLNRLGWSWLDLRGHLRLVGPGIHVDAEVPAFRSRPRRNSALSGSAGVEIACELLLDGEAGRSVRSLARAVGRAPSTVSEVLKALRADDLLERDGTIAEPELFWETATAWRSPDTATVQVPDTALEKALRLGLRDVTSAPGWALTDTLAAAEYGAPVIAAADHPPDFYVPDRATFRRAQALLPRRESGQVATIRVAPVPAVCARRVEPITRWPLAHPLFVALDLAQDAGRGREILEQWRPQGWRRVW